MAVDGKPAVMKVGPALWIGEVDAGQPHGTGDLILPNGSVHHGVFERGRASGPGTLYDATGAVMSGSWINNRRAGAFSTVDPKGGEWADQYDNSGKRISRKKQAPPPAGAAGALRCGQCGVKFHAEHNSRCRFHSGKWMQASEEGRDPAEFPEGGLWLCCGSKVKDGGERCALGEHEVDAAKPGEVCLSRNDKGEVEVVSADQRAAPQHGNGQAVPAVDVDAAGWRDRVRRLVLRSQPFVCAGGEVRLDAAQHAPLAPLAPLAECGLTGCACLRTLYPDVRRRFREEVVRRAAAAREAGALPADGRLCYVSLGAGGLLADLDLLCGLQQAGFTIGSAAFVDTAYRESTPPALAALASYLAPDLAASPHGDAPQAFASAADFALARLRGAQPTAHVFVVMDADEIDAADVDALSAVALSPGGGLGFRLANQHVEGLVPMLAWRRVTPADDPEDDPLGVAVRQVRPAVEAPLEGEPPLEAEAAYARVLEQLDLEVLIARDSTPVPR